PGWHIECSTMIQHVLGDTIDVHWGGRDLIFPHHENEIAQSEAFTGKHPFVRLWMHVGLMQTGSEKMAHSLNNFVTIHDMIESFGADVLRMYLVSEHYRTPVAFSTEYVGRAAERLKRLRSAERNIAFLAAQCATRPDAGSTFSGGKLADLLVEQAQQTEVQFREAMDDDLTTPRAIAAIEALAKRINTTNDEVARSPALATSELSEGLASAAQVFHGLTGVLGLTLAEEPAPSGSEHAADEEVERMVGARTEARARKDFAEADRLRQALSERGITIEDRPQGTIWYRQ
ncbi:MAG: class I tRNA ligase family protein, partial [Chloroflexi bacterium]|nr:class I tRNA ligase family protein [Chloroflexota bacterium]